MTTVAPDAAPRPHPADPSGYFSVLMGHYAIEKEAHDAPPEQLQRRPPRSQGIAQPALDVLFPAVPAHAALAAARRRRSEAPAAAPAPPCAICLAPFEADDAVRVLRPCGHFFHASDDCIDPWLVRAAVTAVLDDAAEADELGEIRHSATEQAHVAIVLGTCPACRRDACADSPPIPLPRAVRSRYGVVLYLAEQGIAVNPGKFSLRNAARRQGCGDGHEADDRSEHSGAWSFSLAPGFDPAAAAAQAAEEARREEEREAQKWINRTAFGRAVKKIIAPPTEWVDDRGHRWVKGHRGVGIHNFLQRN